MKLLLAVLAAVAFAVVVNAAPQLQGTIVTSDEQCFSLAYLKTCKGNRVCFSSSLIGPCCGSCDSTRCGACRSGYTCTGSSCASIWLIIFGSLMGIALLCGILSYVLRQRYYSGTSSSATVVVAQPVYEQETVIVESVAPPPQQAYVPDTYISTTTVVGAPQPVVTYPANQYGAPAGAGYVTTTHHEAY